MVAWRSAIYGARRPSRGNGYIVPQSPEAGSSVKKADEDVAHKIVRDRSRVWKTFWRTGRQDMMNPPTFREKKRERHRGVG